MSGAGAVRGDLLSCYTCALAAYLQGGGEDWLGILAPEPLLAVRPGSADEPVAFRHERRSLRALPPLALRRERTVDPGTFRAGVGDEVRRHGRAVVAGDVHGLPWAAGRGGRHTPHWFVVDAVDGDRWHVTDPFAAVEARGQQSPWSGWLAAGGDLTWAAAPPELEPASRLRERYALGDDGGDPLPGGYQWLRRAAGGEPGGRAVGPGWLIGAGALRLLAGLARRAPERLEAADVWVAARRRLLWAAWLEREGHSPPGGAAAFAEARRLWADLPMRLRYVAESMARGRAPRGELVAGALERLAELEPAPGSSSADLREVSTR